MLKHGWNEDMTTAAKDDLVLVAIATGDPESPIGIEIASWDEEENRWVGEWRWVDAPYAASNPLAWQPTPDIGFDLENLALAEAA